MPRRRNPTATRRAKLEPVTFVPASMAFQPQIKVRTTRDLNGYVDGNPRLRKKWSVGANRVLHVDAEVARVWQAKGYCVILEGDITPVSADELAELSKDDATISLGDPHG